MSITANKLYLLGFAVFVVKNIQNEWRRSDEDGAAGDERAWRPDYRWSIDWAYYFEILKPFVKLNFNKFFSPRGSPLTSDNCLALSRQSKITK